VKFIELAAEKGELSKQLAIVEDMITRKVNAIAIAPVDSAGIAPAINKALAAGIKVVAVDTGISGAKITSYVATDNIKAAMVQGDWAAEQIKDGDTVIYVTGDLRPDPLARNARRASSYGLECQAQERESGGSSPPPGTRPWRQNGVEAALRANPSSQGDRLRMGRRRLGRQGCIDGSGKKAGDVKIAWF